MDEHDPVAQIAAVLEETEPAPIGQIRRMIERCGLPHVEGWLARTQEIESAGGMPTNDGKRRRTPGGVFFYLARGAITDPAVRNYIFERPDAPKRSAKKKKPSGPGAPAAAPGDRWEDRAAWIAAAESGRATTVKVTVIGKPGKPVERQGFTLVRLSHAPKLDAMPKGLPIPAQVPETPYILYIGAKQWRKVSEAIKNTEDVLICEGVQTWDAQQQVMTVFVTNCTTKLLQQAQKSAPPPASA